MRTIKATEDLVVEVWPDWGAAGDTPLVKVRSLALERDGEASPGVVVVFADELEHLVAALAEALEALAGSKKSLGIFSRLPHAGAGAGSATGSVLE